MKGIVHGACGILLALLLFACSVVGYAYYIRYQSEHVVVEEEEDTARYDVPSVVTFASPV